MTTQPLIALRLGVLGLLAPVKVDVDALGSRRRGSGP